MLANPADTIDHTADGVGYIWGARAIGAYLQITPRKAFYLLCNGLIPCRKVGKGYVASRAALDEFLGQVEG